MFIPVANTEVNPYRDMDVNPIQEPKKLALIESMNQTGFWKNVLVRLAPGQEALLKKLGYKSEDDFIERVSMMAKDDQLKITNQFVFQLSYGHHRLAAAQDMKLEHLDLPVSVIDDDTMLKIMANENREDWRSSVIVMLETTKQVYDTMAKQIADSKNWTEYQKKGYKMLDSKGAFDAAKSQGIGFRTLHKFLGETWPINSVNAAHGALACVRQGAYTIDMIKDFPSIDAVRRFNALVNGVSESDLPPLFRDFIVQECAHVISKYGATGKQIDSATAQFRAGNDPVKFLKDQVPVELKIKPWIRNLLRDGSTKEDLSKLPGFDTEKMQQLVDEAIKEVDKAAAREEREASIERRAVELQKENPELTDDAAKSLARQEASQKDKPTDDSGETGAEGEGLLDGEGPSVPMMDDMAGDGGATVSVTSYATTAYASLVTINAQLSRLVGKVAEIPKEENAEFFVALEEQFRLTTQLMAEHIGFKKLAAVYKDVEKGNI